ncbi:MAG: hypothetical protein ACO23K_06720, partial [Ilumatobacteraceae bacterium]
MDGTVRRRYQCANLHRFTTAEKPISTLGNARTLSDLPRKR